MTIFLVRHGEVEGNSGAHRTFAGWRDSPLTARGEMQAQQVAARLEREAIDAVYASDLQRARLTAEAIAVKHGLEVRVEPDLREVNYGKWEGLSEAELKADFAESWGKRSADPVNVAPPDGESYADLWARLQPVWERIVSQTEHKNIVVVGHNGSVRAILCTLLGTPLSNLRRIQINNCSLSRVEIAASGTLIRCLNDTHHLEK